MKYTAEIALKFDFIVPGDNRYDAAVSVTPVMQAAVNQLRRGPVNLAEFLSEYENGRIEYCSHPHETESGMRI
jgi:hypothetical protein